MSDESKKEKELNTELAKLINQNSHEQSGHSQPYKCGVCGDRVSYTFLLPYIKASGLCPNCWHKEGSDE